MSVALQPMVDEVLSVLEKYLGTYTKDLYAEFYKTQDKETILNSAHELLTEMLGQAEGEKFFSEIQKKYAQ